MKPYQAIAAMSLNRVIGRGAKIPWHLPEEFRWFKAKTMGNTLIMGRKTYESIGRPLPGRVTVVVTRTGGPYPGTLLCRDLKDIPSLPTQGILFVAGGADLYRQTLPDCSDLFLTTVKQTIEGDVLFPPFEGFFRLKETLVENADFRTDHYVSK